MDNKNTTKEQTTTTMENSYAEWETVSFSKGTKQRRNISHQNFNNPTKNTNDLGIFINLFNTNTGKYLDTQLLQYKSKETINTLKQNSAKNPATMVKDQTTLPIKNHFSLLDSEQTLSEETTNDKINNKLKNNNKHASEHLSS